MFSDFPHCGEHKSSFKRTWEENLLLCSKGMMLLLKEEYAKRLRELDKDVDSFYNLFSQYKDHSAYAQSDKELSEHLENFNHQILMKKEKKMQRDKMAFQGDKAFSWSPIYSKKAFQSSHSTRFKKLPSVRCFFYLIIIRFFLQFLQV